MKFRPIFLFLIIILAFLLTACSGSAMQQSSWPGLSVGQDAAYVAYHQHVYAVDLKSGTEIWRYPAQPDAKKSFYAPPQLSEDGQLLVASYDSNLYSLNPSNGQENWSFTDSTNHYIGSPLAAPSAIYAPSSDNNLYAIDYTGKSFWTAPFTTDSPLWAQPATDDTCECVYLTSMDHQVYALNATNGSLIWETPDLGGAIAGSPVLDDNGKLFVGTFNNELLALSTQNGQTIWKFPTQNWVWSGPALVNDILYFGDIDGNFYAINASSGSELWNFKVDGAILSTPLVTTDQIYITTDTGLLYALDKSGQPVFNRTIGLTLHAPAVAAGDLILVAPGDQENLIVAIHPDGSQVWSFNPEPSKK